jgi:hypothetical protein
MNDKASQLVHEIGGLVLESVSEAADAWTMTVARFEFFDGTTKENFAYLSEGGDATFFHPSLDDDIFDKINSLREETRLNDERWIVCLIRVSPSGQVKITFEYTDSDKWNPQSFQHLDFS